jgi:hypothetical protein
MLVTDLGNPRGGSKSTAKALSRDRNRENSFTANLIKTTFLAIRFYMFSLNPFEEFTQRDLQGSRKSLYGIQPWSGSPALDPVDRSALDTAGHFQFPQGQPSGLA